VRQQTIWSLLGALLASLGIAQGLGGCASPEAKSADDGLTAYDRLTLINAQDMIGEGKQIFRFETFGSEAFWGDSLQLHRAIAGDKNGGVGLGVTPKQALSLGLKLDAEALPDELRAQISAGKVDFDDPAATLTLLKLNAVLGVRGLFDAQGKLISLGMQCALCHSTVDNSLAPGVGRRLDGWAARDLNFGAIIALAPNLKPFTGLLGIDEVTLRRALASWGPGRFDALLEKDGVLFRPDGDQAGTLIPPAFGLAGVNLMTWTGVGSIPYSNANAAATEMHGSGTFFDARLREPGKFPVAARSGLHNLRGKPDLISSKLAALHIYQLALPAPRPPLGSYDPAAAERGKALFRGKARCSTCHVPPLFTEPGHNLHSPAEIGVDAFQAYRSPTRMYRTAPLAGLWTHQKGGFYHDGRFATLRELLQHYDTHFKLELSEQDKGNLVEYLKSL
jgi:hypothetical protein